MIQIYLQYNSIQIFEYLSVETKITPVKKNLIEFTSLIYQKEKSL